VLVHIVWNLLNFTVNDNLDVEGCEDLWWMLNFIFQTPHLQYIQHRAAMADWLKAVLRLRIAAAFMSKYISGWCGHGLNPIRNHFC